MDYKTIETLIFFGMCTFIIAFGMYVAYYSIKDDRNETRHRTA